MPTAITRSIRIWDVIWWAVAVFGVFGLGVYAIVNSPGAPNWAVVLIASFVVAVWVAAFAYWYQIAVAWDYLQYTTAFGTAVGWTSQKYAVAPGNYAEIEEEVITKLLGPYPNAVKALNGCIVLFREQKFFVSVSQAPWYLKRVAGAQSGILIEIGWNKNLHETELLHELGRRILRFHGVITNESVEERILKQYGC